MFAYGSSQTATGMVYSSWYTGATYGGAQNWISGTFQERLIRNTIDIFPKNKAVAIYEDFNGYILGGLELEDLAQYAVLTGATTQEWQLTSTNPWITNNDDAQRSITYYYYGQLGLTSRTGTKNPYAGMLNDSLRSGKSTTYQQIKASKGMVVEVFDNVAVLLDQDNEIPYNTVPSAADPDLVVWYERNQYGTVIPRAITLAELADNIRWYGGSRTNIYSYGNGAVYKAYLDGTEETDGWYQIDSTLTPAGATWTVPYGATYYVDGTGTNFPGVTALTLSIAKSYVLDGTLKVTGASGPGNQGKVTFETLGLLTVPSNYVFGHDGNVVVDIYGAIDYQDVSGGGSTYSIVGVGAMYDITPTSPNANANATLTFREEYLRSTTTNAILQRYKFFTVGNGSNANHAVLELNGTMIDHNHNLIVTGTADLKINTPVTSNLVAADTAAGQKWATIQFQANSKLLAGSDGTNFTAYATTITIDVTTPLAGTTYTWDNTGTGSWN
ncbi:MAG: hypothetical protein LBC65_04000, partial [Oscillospiraceae bacterium]|jgi:hypothetical protein|nr:hypothetical protein [Oscillospiraceae bacterium]